MDKVASLPIGHTFSKAVRMGAVLVGIVLFIALILYGISVVIETHILSVGRKARIVEEDNQAMQVQLDRLRSYQNVSALSSQTQGLTMPVATVEVADTPRTFAALPAAPETPPPSEAYGY